MNKFSIILPVRNGGEYIKLCVNSILSQTITAFDLIILDNKSTDGTTEWLRSQNDARIRLFISDVPLSIEENWARIMYVPKNEFITIIGHDDLLDFNYLAKMDALIKKYPNASLYQSHFRFINTIGSTIRKARVMKSKYSVDELLKALLLDEIDTMGTGYMMRSKDYEELRGIPAFANLLFADHVLWVRLASLSYLAVNEDLAFSYRVNQGMSRITGAAKYIDAYISFLAFLSELKTKSIQYQEVIQQFSPVLVKKYCRSLAHRLLRTPVSMREGKTISILIKLSQNFLNNLPLQNQLRLSSISSIKIAQIIDENIFLRSMYLFFRRFVSKSLYKS